ncbi:hypothetical protein FRB96_007091 [Tulasnella sp. 330]|nr:hypothetical protein FRB96_007091 [Tulasnella sp. 330]KAG8880053.1 hypothetical protein FRB97_001204 [Tulasnella sp. 331]KAG8887179.1 hypothetical protein FRB98_000389 [Tulasnella sp. 332]
MIGDLIEYLAGKVSRVINRGYRNDSVQLIARCRELKQQVKKGERPFNQTEIDDAIDAAKKALEFASSRRASHEQIKEQFRLAERALTVCLGDPKVDILQTADWQVITVKNTGESAAQDLFKRDEWRVPPCTQSTPAAAPEAVNPLAAASVPITDSITAPGSSPASSNVPNAPPDEQMLAVEVKVYEENLEQAVATKIYFLDACSSVSALIWKLTKPKDGLIELRRHTEPYTRDEGRHGYTSGGLQFDWVLPKTPLRSLPYRNDMVSLCVIWSDSPYLVIVAGTDRLSKGVISASGRDRGMILKDYHNAPLRRSIPPPHTTVTYCNKCTNQQYQIRSNDTYTWGSMPSNDVRECSADWLLILPPS